MSKNIYWPNIFARFFCRSFYCLSHSLSVSKFSERGGGGSSVDKQNKSFRLFVFFLLFLDFIAFFGLHKTRFKHIVRTFHATRYSEHTHKMKKKKRKPFYEPSDGIRECRSRLKQLHILYVCVFLYIVPPCASICSFFLHLHIQCVIILLLAYFSKKKKLSKNGWQFSTLHKKC